VSWKTKKQQAVARSSVEAEYISMGVMCYEVAWLLQLLKDLGLTKLLLMGLKCDNQAIIHIAPNPIFHEGSKHIEVECHFVRDKLKQGSLILAMCPKNINC